MADLTFVPFEFPQSDDGKYTALVTEDSILKIRRDQLGLSQQNVADMTQIPLTQYQRLESGDNVLAGASMRIGLAVCAALLLDPYDFINVNVSQPDPNDMKPVPMFHTDLPDDLLAPKKTGRKTTWKDIKTVFINYDGYSLLIPYDVLNILGGPQYVQMSWQLKQRRIVLRAANKHEEGALDVPEEKYENSIFALPEIKEKRNPIAAMGWGVTPYSVEARLVRDHSDVIYLMIDLKTAKPADKKQINGVFITPECLYNEDDEEWFDWEDSEGSL